MFNIATRPTFTRTVEVQSPDGDGLRTDTFKATFNWVPSDELEKFDAKTTDSIKGFLRAVVVRCEDLVGEAEDGSGKPVPLPWSDEVREALFAWSNVRTALLLAYNKAWLEEKRGN